MPLKEEAKQDFSKLRSIFAKNSGHKTAKLRSHEQKTQVRVSKTQVFGNKVFVFVCKKCTKKSLPRVTLFAGK